MSESLATVHVARGRTVCTGNWPSFDRHGPGSKIELPIAEAYRLRRLGFVQDTPPVLTSVTNQNNPAAIGPQNAHVQGPTFRR
jgi:hypothetical protein